jgi:hypothetical protein
MIYMKHTGRCEAVDERVTGETIRADTNRTMVHDLALGVATTSADTRIYAFLIHACLIWTAFGIY